LGHDFAHTPIPLLKAENPLSIWKELRAECPGSTPALSSAVSATTYICGEGNRLRYRAYFPRVPASFRAPTSAPTYGDGTTDHIDPPEHKPAKQLLLPPFTPDAMKKLEPRFRAICNELIDRIHRGRKVRRRGTLHQACSGRAIAHMLGIPERT